jgi:hypothetical protein
MSNQTAVEWLLQQMLKEGYFEGEKPFTFTNLAHLQQEALAMEKELIVDAHFEGQCDNTEGYPLQIAKQYYNETYKGGQDE